MPTRSDQPLALAELLHGETVLTTRGFQVEDVRDTDEAGDERCRRSLVELARRRDLLDDALVHDRDPVGHRQRLFLIVRHVDERRLRLLLDVLQLELHLLAQLQVERAERLVEQQGGGTVDQRPREGNALLLAARELARLALVQALEPNGEERVRDARLDVGARRPS